MRINSIFGILCLLQRHLAAQLMEDLCSYNITLTLEHPTCRVPQTIISIPSTTALEEQLQATATSHEGKFLSFEEWKAQNLQQQARPQASRPTTHLSSHAVASSTSVLQSVSSVDQTTTTDPSEPSQISQPAKHSHKQEAEVDDPKLIGKKERFNHASFDCAASIVQSNKESKGSSNVLKENKDYYMLNTCAAEHKFVTIELCNDILVDSIQLANFEFFSGVFKDVRVLVAAKYPPGREGWQELGHFKARPAREIQTFSFENPLIWARYVRVEMLTFYGNEFYCPLSLVRVFGKTMMEDYKQEGTPETDESQDLQIPVAQDSASQEMLSNIERAAEGLVAMSDELADSMQKNDYGIQEPATTVAVEILSASTTNSTATPPTKTTFPTKSPITVGDLGQSTCAVTPTNLPLAYPIEIEVNSTITTSVMVIPSSMTTMRAEPSAVSSTVEQLAESDSQSNTILTNTTASALRHDTSDNGTIDPSRSRAQPSNQPSTQESIYKQMAKRISLLEANATLSLRYIESQSSLLAQSFSHLSSTQARHLAHFLENVNTTMLQRIAHLKQEYEQLHLDATRSITAARHRQEVDMKTLSRKIGVLSDDITFFKRLGIFQSVLMLVLFGFLVTSRHAGVDLQNSLHRALNPRSQLGSPISRVDSPSTWRQHLRGQSAAGHASIYSFPVEQIQRPQRTVSTSHLSSYDHDDYTHGVPVRTPQHSTFNPHETMKSRTGLGIHLSQDNDDIVSTDAASRHKTSNMEVNRQHTQHVADIDSLKEEAELCRADLNRNSGSPLSKANVRRADVETRATGILANESSQPEARPCEVIATKVPDESISSGAEDYPTPGPDANDAED